MQKKSEEDSIKERAEFVLDALEYAEAGTIQYRCPDCRQYFLMKDEHLLKDKIDSHICGFERKAVN